MFNNNNSNENIINSNNELNSYTDSKFFDITKDGELFLSEEATCSIDSDYYSSGSNNIDEYTDCGKYNEEWLKIKNLNIPKTINNIKVKTIGKMAFAIDSGHIESVNIPDTVTNIKDGAFEWGFNLKTINIPENVTEIGALAFYDTPWLKKQQENNPLVIVNNILIDGENATGKIIIPENVHTISNQAFMDNYNLTDIVFHSNIKKIGGWAFKNTSWLKSMQEKNDVIIINDILIDGENAKEDFQIPTNVKSIANYAFASNDSISSVVIPNGIKEIGSQAFYSCNNLTSVKYNNTSYTDFNELKEILLTNDVLLGENIFDFTLLLGLYD